MVHSSGNVVMMEPMSIAAEWITLLVAGVIGAAILAAALFFFGTGKNSK